MQSQPRHREPPPRERPRLLVVLGLLLCLPPLVSTAGRLRSSGEPTHSEEQFAFLRRLSPVKAMLEGTPRVGFLSDLPAETPPIYGFRHPHEQEREALVRLSMLPTLVVRGPGEAIVLGVFADTAKGLADAARLGLRAVRTFDDGVVVLSREP